MVYNSAFTESLDLPSFEAGMNFFFNLELDSRIDYGLFPIVPYGSAPFRPDPIHIDQSLLKFEFDLDPNSNNGEGLPPTFVMLENTPFEQRLGLLDDGEYLGEAPFSVQMSVKDDPVKRRLDLGSGQLVNPFGKGDSILGPEERNLTITGSMSDSKIEYSFQTGLLRLGLDLDGIAAFLGSAALTGAGHSFTHFDEKFFEDKVSVEGDLIDVKYGPEFGYRETVTIEPEFEVTLNFDDEVAINDHGQISFTNSFKGKWSDLPGIALIGDEPVEVTVNFDRVTGKQTKRAVFYVTDYLDLTVMEIEKLSFYDTFELELPALFSKRTSLLGKLLEEAELEITNQNQTIAPFNLNTGPVGTSSFTLTPAPSKLVYWSGGVEEFSTSPSDWRELATHTAPASLQNAVLVIGRGGGTEQVISDLEFERLEDDGDDLDVVTSVAGLVIPKRSTFTQRGARTWSLSRIVNDGLYQTVDQCFTRFRGLVLTITGQGLMRFDGTLELDAALLFHGPDHTIILRDPRSIGGEQHRFTAQQFENAGQIVTERGGATDLTATQRLTNSGSIIATAGGSTLTTPLLINDGLIEVRGANSFFSVNHPALTGQVSIQSTTGTGQFIADNKGTMQFVTVLLDSPPGDSDRVQFKATNGGTIRFDNLLRVSETGLAELHVDETSKLVLNGINVARREAQVSLVNKGLVEVQDGQNRLYWTPIILRPKEPPPPGSHIVGINIINEGTIRIQPRAAAGFALLGFQAEIANYVPGGATLGPGTWELIGQAPTNPYKNDMGISAPLGLREAILEILITRISNEETYLGRIDLGDTNGDGIRDGYSPEDYDTQLAVSEANVLLSGAARFDYFNTVRENRGSFTLRNKNHFDTVGGLVNKGAIRVEAESRLNVFGDLTIDEGTVLVDGNAILDVKGNTIEVIGGNVTVQRPDVPLFVNTPWIVREKWIGLDAEGNDIVLEGRVSYGDAWFPTIGPNGDILVEGKRAVFEPLSRLNRVQGKLTLTGGNELRLAQSLTNEGTLELAKAGKLYVDGNLTNRGQLVIDTDSYLDVTGAFNVTAGSIQLDGVVHAASLDASAGTVLSGAGRFTGSLNIGGAFMAKVAGAATGGEQNELFVDGQVALGGDLQLMLGGVIPSAADTFTILNAARGLAGVFNNVAAGQRLDTVDGLGSFLVHYGADSPFNHNQITLSAFEPGLVADFDEDGDVDGNDLAEWRNGFGTSGSAIHMDGDADADLDVDGADFLVWQRQLGGGGAPAVVVSAPVPEPTPRALLWTMALLHCRPKVNGLFCCRRRQATIV